MNDKLEKLIKMYKKGARAITCLEESKRAITDGMVDACYTLAWLETEIAEMVGYGNNYKGEAGVIGWRKSTSVEVEDESLVPPQYKVTTVIERIDKATIKEDLKNGANLPWAKLVDKNNIQIG